jgi:hypothetical protein
LIYSSEKAGDVLPVSTLGGRIEVAKIPLKEGKFYAKLRNGGRRVWAALPLDRRESGVFQA